MKRKHSVCAVIMIVAIVGIILSCSNNPTLENKLEETGYVSFGNANSRSLSVMYEMEDFDDLYWFYTATKADRYGQTGQTNGEEPVPAKANGKGIGDGTVGPFSMGDWDFNLYAYKDEGKTIKVYEGKTPSRVNIVAGDTKNISVAVSPYGTTGTLKIDKAYFNWDSTSGGDLPVIHLTMDKNKSDETTDQSFDIVPVANENGDITFALNKTIPVGFYYCRLWATIDTASTPIYETEEFTLRIYGATTTTIYGDITEQTGPSVSFSAISDNSDLMLITGSDTFAVLVDATPAGNDTTTIDFGTYNVGTSSTTDEDGKVTKVFHTLEVAVSSYDTSDTSRFVVDSGRDAVAALDLTLTKTTKVTDTEGNETTTTTEPVTTFGEGNEVTITTYIEKNLFDVKVRYNNGTDTPEEITPESYTPATGELVFKVSHFSEYYVVAKLPEARIGSVYYKTFDDAWNAATEGSIIEIENDVVFDSSFEMNKKNITINGNGYRFVASDSYYYTTKPAYNMCLANTSGSEGLVFNNIVFDGNNKTYSLIGSGKDKTFNNCVFKNSLNGHYYGVSNGYLKFKDCEFYCNMYNVNQSEGGCVVSFEDCILSGWNSFGDSETVSFTRTTFTKVPENLYSIVRTYSSTTFTDCSFTEKFVEHEDDRFGSGINPVQQSVAELNNCKVVDSEGNISTSYSLSNACKPSDSSVCVIDGQKREGKYYSGTVIGDSGVVEGIITDYSSVKENSDGSFTIISLSYEDDNTYSIGSSEQLVLFANLVNIKGNAFSGKTVKLTDDISLSGITWTPIGTSADGANKFQGIFDGQEHTISNMTVNQGVEYHAAGFFGALNGTAKNIIFDNATVTSISAPNADGNTDNGTAVVAGSIYTSGSIEGVTVKNSRVSGNRYVGGISGYTYGSVKNCTVENTTVTSTPDNLHNEKYDNGDKAGGVVGAFWHENTHEIYGNTVKNVKVKGYRDIGGIVGYANGNVVRNTVNGLTLIQDYSILTTPRTTVEAVIGRHDNFEVDASNTATDVIVRVDNVSTDTEFSASLKNKAHNIIVNLSGDVKYDVTPWINGTGTMGGADTEAITINGNDHTITFNNLNNDWNGIYIANEDAVLTINNAKITNSGHNDGPYNSHDINFQCKVILNNVVSDKAIAVAKNATLNKVDISDERDSDDYLLWIEANGSTVNITDCNLHNTKTGSGTTRGVAIKDQYVGTPASVTLNVSGTTFVTANKAAVLVTSTAGANINWGIGNNITGVAADKNNAVWNDSKRTAAWDLVTVKGCSKFQET